MDDRHDISERTARRAAALLFAFVATLLLAAAAGQWLGAGAGYFVAALGCAGVAVYVARRQLPWLRSWQQ
jgi:hypothetical protein